MCRYCDYESDDNRIFIDPLTNEYYLDIETSEWDDYDDGFVHQKGYINYCPWCGRKLADETGFENNIMKIKFKNGSYLESIKSTNIKRSYRADKLKNFI